MNLKDQVISLRHAMRLDTLGCKVDSYFFWCINEYNPKNVRIQSRYDYDIRDTIYPAYTVAELIGILPSEIEHDFSAYSTYLITIGYEGEEGKPGCWYEDDNVYGSDNILHGTSADTFAECLADMLIYLIENKLIPMPL